jgi:diguanylate cyclase (GGDEF)-like protein
MKTIVRGTRHQQRNVGRQSWILGVAAIGLTIGAFVTRSQSIELANRAVAHQRTVDAVQLVETRGRAGSAFLAEQNANVLLALGTIDESKKADASTERVRAHAVVMDELRRLAEGDGPTAGEATQLIAEYTRLGVIDAGELEADVISEAAAVSRTGGVTKSPSSALLAIEQLSSAAGLPELVMFDITATIYTVDKPDVVAPWDQFFSNAEPYVKNTAGWFGDDASTPTKDGRFVLTEARDLRPDLVAQADEFLRPLWPMDSWRTSWTTSVPGPPPSSFADFVEMTDRTVADMQSWRTQLLTNERLAAQRLATDTKHSSDQLKLVALGLAIAAIVAGVGAIGTLVKRNRTSRRITQQAFTDGLTGVGNRYALHDEVTHLVSNASFVSHLVAIADMDRFKMINDTWGHHAGDRALVETANRLVALVAAVTKDLAGSQGSVVRLGGDEFLFSLHSKTIIDEAMVRAHLDTMMQPLMDLGDGVTAPLELSVGIATSDGTATLSDLMTAADLEVYNNKSQRAAARAAISLSTPALPAPTTP